MKKISTIILIICNLYSIGQNTSIDKSIIEEVFLTLPDSLVKTSFFELPKSHREALWSIYKKGIRDKSQDSLEFYLFVDEKDNKIKIISTQSDQTPELEIKIFNFEFKTIVGTTFSYYDGATTSSEGISFYDYTSSKIQDITNKVLKNFNFFTENYSDSTINLLSKYWKTNLREGSGPCMSLIYDFTSSDTIEISDSFFGYFYDENPDPGLDSTYFDGEFYTKKYILENGKLRLAE
jgi:hypothetical protein